MPLCHKCASNHFATPSALLLSMIPVAISFNSSIAFLVAYASSAICRIAKYNYPLAAA